MISEGIEFIQVYHFDGSGYLVRIENYNDFHVDEDSLHLGEVTYYEYTAPNSRKSFTLSAERGDTLRTATYEIFGKAGIKVSVKDYSNNYFTEIFQTLDEQGRIVVTSSMISDQLSDAIYSASSTKFIYDRSGLQKLIVVNERTGNEGKELTCQNRSYDKAGNVTHLEYRDESGVIVSRIYKAYEY